MITYKNGDLLKSDCDIICHQVNCQKVMGSGIAKQIRERFPQAYKVYLNGFKHYGNPLGKISSVFCGGVLVVNMYAQNNYLPRGVRHTDYDAFRSCLREIKSLFGYLEGSVNKKIGFPSHIGCGLGGGDWNIVEQIIKEEFEGNEWIVEIWNLN